MGRVHDRRDAGYDTTAGRTEEIRHFERTYKKMLIARPSFTNCCTAMQDTHLEMSVVVCNDARSLFSFSIQVRGKG